MSDEKELDQKQVLDRMREAAELLQTYSAKGAATKAMKAASTASIEATNTASLAAELAVVAATAAVTAAKAATDAALAAANVARLARAAENAFHETDDAARAELPDEALRWSIEATKYADAAVAAAVAATKALHSSRDTTKKQQ